jgi:hypothetical protein
MPSANNIFAKGSIANLAALATSTSQGATLATQGTDLTAAQATITLQDGRITTAQGEVTAARVIVDANTVKTDTNTIEVESAVGDGPKPAKKAQEKSGVHPLYFKSADAFNHDETFATKKVSIGGETYFHPCDTKSFQKGSHDSTRVPASVPATPKLMLEDDTSLYELTPYDNTFVESTASYPGAPSIVSVSSRKLLKKASVVPQAMCDLYEASSTKEEFIDEGVAGYRLHIMEDIVTFTKYSHPTEFVRTNLVDATSWTVQDGGVFTHIKDLGVLVCVEEADSEGGVKGAQFSELSGLAYSTGLLYLKSKLEANGEDAVSADSIAAGFQAAIGVGSVPLTEAYVAITADGAATFVGTSDRTHWFALEAIGPDDSLIDLSGVANTEVGTGTILEAILQQGIRLRKASATAAHDNGSAQALGNAVDLATAGVTLSQSVTVYEMDPASAVAVAVAPNSARIWGLPPSVVIPHSSEGVSLDSHADDRRSDLSGSLLPAPSVRGHNTGHGISDQRVLVIIFDYAEESVQVLEQSNNLDDAGTSADVRKCIESLLKGSTAQFDSIAPHGKYDGKLRTKRSPAESNAVLRKIPRTTDASAIGAEELARAIKSEEHGAEKKSMLKLRQLAVTHDKVNIQAAQSADPMVRNYQRSKQTGATVAFDAVGQRAAEISDLVSQPTFAKRQALAADWPSDDKWELYGSYGNPALGTDPTVASLANGGRTYAIDGDKLWCIGNLPGTVADLSEAFWYGTILASAANDPNPLFQNLPGWSSVTKVASDHPAAVAGKETYFLDRDTLNPGMMIDISSFIPGAQPGSATATLKAIKFVLDTPGTASGGVSEYVMIKAPSTAMAAAMFGLATFVGVVDADGNPVIDPSTGNQAMMPDQPILNQWSANPVAVTGTELLATHYIGNPYGAVHPWASDASSTYLDRFRVTDTGATTYSGDHTGTISMHGRYEVYAGPNQITGLTDRRYVRKTQYDAATGLYGGLWCFADGFAPSLNAKPLQEVFEYIGDPANGFPTLAPWVRQATPSGAQTITGGVPQVDGDGNPVFDTQFMMPVMDPATGQPVLDGDGNPVMLGPVPYLETYAGDYTSMPNGYMELTFQSPLGPATFQVQGIKLCYLNFSGGSKPDTIEFLNLAGADATADAFFTLIMGAAPPRNMFFMAGPPVPFEKLDGPVR